MTIVNNRGYCFFRQLEGNIEEIPQDFLDVLNDLPEHEPETAEGLAKELTALEAPICTVEGCRLSTLGVLRYITSAGADAPRQELDEMVAPSCVMLDVPHDAEQILGRYAYPGDPRTPDQ